MSIIKTIPNERTQEHNGWVDYLLMFVFIPVLHKTYPARSQEPVHRTALMIVYLLKTPVQSLTAFMLVKPVFGERLLGRFEVYLFLAIIIGFYELIFHRVLHINKHTLKLLKDRRIRQRTQAFMKDNPNLSSLLIWTDMLLIVGYLCFFGIYMAFVILTSMQ